VSSAAPVVRSAGTGSVWAQSSEVSRFSCNTRYEQSGAVAITDAAADVVVTDNTFTAVGVGVKTYGLNTLIRNDTFQNLIIAYVGMDSGPLRCRRRSGRD